MNKDDRRRSRALALRQPYIHALHRMIAVRHGIKCGLRKRWRDGALFRSLIDTDFLDVRRLRAPRSVHLHLHSLHRHRIEPVYLEALHVVLHLRQLAPFSALKPPDGIVLHQHLRFRPHHATECQTRIEHDAHLIRRHWLGEVKPYRLRKRLRGIRPPSVGAGTVRRRVQLRTRVTIDNIFRFGVHVPRHRGLRVERKLKIVSDVKCAVSPHICHAPTFGIDVNAPEPIHALADTHLQPHIFLRVVAPWQRIEAHCVKCLQLSVEIVAALREQNHVVDIVHRQLMHPALQCQSRFGGQRVGNLVEPLDHRPEVVQPFQSMPNAGGIDDGVVAFAIEIGLGSGSDDRVAAQQQLRSELLVLVVDARREAQFAQHRSAEEIAPGRSPQVLCAHEGGAAHGGCIVADGGCFRLAGIVEKHHVGPLVANDVETVFVAVPDEHVVAVYKLYILSAAETDARVAGLTESFVGLSDVDDVVYVEVQLRQWRLLGTVVNEDDFSFGGTQRERQNAVKTHAQQVDRQVIAGDDEAHERLLLI